MKMLTKALRDTLVSAGMSMCLCATGLIFNWVADAGGCRCDGHGEVPVIARVGHGLYLHGAQPAGVGQAGGRVRR